MCTQIFSEGTPFYPFYPLEKSLVEDLCFRIFLHEIYYFILHTLLLSQQFIDLVQLFDLTVIYIYMYIYIYTCIIIYVNST